MEENEEMSSTPVLEPEKKSNNTMGIAAIVIIVVAIGGFVLMNRGSKQEETQESMMGNDNSQDTMVADTGATPSVEGASDSAALVTTANGVTTVTMEAGSFYYKPNQIKVKKGDKVKIVITSHDMMHNFNIDELNVKSSLVKAGQTSTVEFTADKVGSFEYYCSVGEHRARGQVGTLIVTE